MFKNNDKYPRFYFDDEYTLQLYMTYDEDGDIYDVTFIMKIFKKYIKRRVFASNLIFETQTTVTRYNHSFQIFPTT